MAILIKIVNYGLLTFFFSVCSSFPNNENYTKVEHANNIYVGSKNFYQKIKMFYINDSELRCTDRYLPILFVMINSHNIEKEVDGYLTEYGDLIEKQETGHCRTFKK